MNNAVVLIVAWTAGIVLGTIFFGGLWWTIQQGVASRVPALWFLASLVLRMSIAVGGFWFVSGGHWERLLACLVGFVMTQWIVTWRTCPKSEHPRVAPQEVGNAHQS